MNKNKLKEILDRLIGNTAIIPCPLCATFFDDEEQVLIPEGDSLLYLFCPHCGFTVDLNYTINNWILIKLS